MKKSLSDGEWTLMKKLWETSPMTITQLTSALRDETGWSKHTVISMLSRLENKEAIAHRDGIRAKEYYPLLLREDASHAETAHFLDKVYGGRVGLMMSAMIDSHALSPDDIEELSAILEQAKGDKLK